MPVVNRKPGKAEDSAGSLDAEEYKSPAEKFAARKKTAKKTCGVTFTCVGLLLAVGIIYDLYYYWHTNSRQLTWSPEEAGLCVKDSSMYRGGAFWQFPDCFAAASPEKVLCPPISPLVNATEAAPECNNRLRVFPNRYRRGECADEDADHEGNTGGGGQIGHANRGGLKCPTSMCIVDVKDNDTIVHEHVGSICVPPGTTDDGDEYVSIWGSVPYRQHEYIMEHIRQYPEVNQSVLGPRVGYLSYQNLGYEAGASQYHRHEHHHQHHVHIRHDDRPLVVPAVKYTMESIPTPISYVGFSAGGQRSMVAALGALHGLEELTKSSHQGGGPDYSAEEAATMYMPTYVGGASGGGIAALGYVEAGETADILQLGKGPEKTKAKLDSLRTGVESEIKDGGSGNLLFATGIQDGCMKKEKVAFTTFSDLAAKGEGVLEVQNEWFDCVSKIHVEGGMLRKRHDKLMLDETDLSKIKTRSASLVRNYKSTGVKHIPFPIVVAITGAKEGGENVKSTIEYTKMYFGNARPHFGYHDNKTKFPLPPQQFIQANAYLASHSAEHSDSYSFGLRISQVMARISTATAVKGGDKESAIYQDYFSRNLHHIDQTTRYNYGEESTDLVYDEEKPLWKHVQRDYTHFRTVDAAPFDGGGVFPALRRGVSRIVQVDLPVGKPNFKYILDYMDAHTRHVTPWYTESQTSALAEVLNKANFPYHYAALFGVDTWKPYQGFKEKNNHIFLRQTLRTLVEALWFSESDKQRGAVATIRLQGQYDNPHWGVPKDRQYFFTWIVGGTNLVEFIHDWREPLLAHFKIADATDEDLLLLVKGKSTPKGQGLDCDAYAYDAADGKGWPHLSSGSSLPNICTFLASRYMSWIIQSNKAHLNMGSSFYEQWEDTAGEDTDFRDCLDDPLYC
mmetsp:Transcript_136310/g.237013  ORF Transcript_136310/g.237013 Transcript_136310/m.237013 type:complete len:904 (+) Transcript_136310:152-2863(+)